jgi:serine/threonine protein kinase
MKAIKKEVGILSSSRHPNLVQIMAFSEESFKAFILMEYVNGNNLELIIFPDEQLQTPCITLNDSDKL